MNARFSNSAGRVETLCACAPPLHEVRVLNPYRKALLPDVDGLQGPCMLQLGRHIVHIKDPRKLAQDTAGVVGVELQ